MTEELNSSLDSLELEIYHRPNPKIQSILNYLRKIDLKFCTNPKKKQEEYTQRNTETSKEGFSLQNNKFFNRKQTNKNIDCAVL
ncbi:unnamed protein product (macronuclear) [Paramecium tetraurelia]|uniref:Uncharacterized protein n=1 Tax=Paramecium tetraurelia TaxID=5888 RepID=A0DPZ3_PARTE|nr:uncharacterized protein GSPATT00002509001 [Paramecium tetraurelia]CAK85110.1 unnamed protein product [Paramecium tetraurelia]|eukprot:XP_001452507.1 hypothetical protein (macronuclear) [Paramecium tetraurelia strain d4-2]